MIIAEFYKGTKRKPCVVDILKLIDGQRIPVATRNVKDKREARSVAEFYNAICWNF
jgi:hypothetical protein